MRKLSLATLALALVVVGGCCSINREALSKESEVETKLMAELSAYVAADPAKSQATKDAELQSIQAHLKLFQSLNASK